MNNRDDLVPVPRSFDLDDPHLVAALRELMALRPVQSVRPAVAGFSNYMPVPWSNTTPTPSPDE